MQPITSNRAEDSGAEYNAGSVSTSLFKMMLCLGIMTTSMLAVIYQYYVDQEDKALINALICVAYIVVLAVLMSRPQYTREIVYVGIIITGTCILLITLNHPTHTYWAYVFSLISFALLGKTRV